MSTATLPIKKKAVVSLGHSALGGTTLEQLDAVKITAKALAGLVERVFNTCN